ncbi:hypothetical protein MNBD_GAMMA25-722 [hydrothermal vent metagenome]|uniref:Lipopolysaccharide export system permease protein LptF n=1 Tax=hydrothermal vent metagenome TaxID=652676 RepID=A0A3B1BBU5_9ZZZZ
MIITRYLLKEIFSTLLGVMLVLIMIAVSVQMVGSLSKVSAGVIQPGTLMLVLGLNMFSLITYILPLALYLAILLSLSRLYRDSEMTAIAACGVGPFHIMRIVLILGIFFALVQGTFTVWLTPWAEGHYSRLTEKSKRGSDIEGVMPGRFNELRGAQGVVYVQEIDKETGELKNIFLQMQQKSDQKKGGAEQFTVIAKRAYKMRDEKTGDQFLILEEGSRYEGVPGDEHFAILDFQKHGIRMEEKPLVIHDRRYRAIPSKELLNSDNLAYQVELRWRISSALICIGLAMLAVPLSRTSQRQGRYGKLAVAMVLYILVTNFLSVVRGWIQKDTISLELGFWWVHVLVIILALLLLSKQSSMWTLFRRSKQQVDR